MYRETKNLNPRSPLPCRPRAGGDPAHAVCSTLKVRLDFRLRASSQNDEKITKKVSFSIAIVITIVFLFLEGVDMHKKETFPLYLNGDKRDFEENAGIGCYVILFGFQERARQVGQPFDQLQTKSYPRA